MPYEKIKKKLEINDIENVKVLNYSVSNAEGEMEFFIGKDDKCGSIVKTERENGDTIIVKTQILDTIVKQNNFKPDFIKIDIGSAE